MRGVEHRYTCTVVPNFFEHMRSSNLGHECESNMRRNFVLSTVSPDTDNLHTESQSCKDRLDALSEPFPLDCLPHLFAVNIVALCLEIQRRSPLVGTAAEGHSVVNRRPRCEGEDRSVEQIRVARSSGRQEVGGEQCERRDMTKIRGDVLRFVRYISRSGTGVNRSRQRKQ